MLFGWEIFGLSFWCYVIDTDTPPQSSFTLISSQLHHNPLALSAIPESTPGGRQDLRHYNTAPPYGIDIDYSGPVRSSAAATGRISPACATDNNLSRDGNDSERARVCGRNKLENGGKTWRLQRGDTRSASRKNVDMLGEKARLIIPILI